MRAVHPRAARWVLAVIAACACFGVLAQQTVPAQPGAETQSPAPALDSHPDAPEPAVRPSLTYDGDAARVLRGGARTGNAYVGNLHLRVVAKAPEDSQWAGTTAFVDVLNIHGRGPGVLAGSAQDVSNIDGPSGTHVEELWVQHNFGDSASALMGIYDLNSEFYRLQAAGLFVNSSFGIGPEFAQSGIEGPSIFPRTSAGLRLSAKPAPGVVLRAALLDGAPVVRPDGSSGIFRSGDGLLGVAEAAFLTRAGPPFDPTTDPRQRQGRFSSLPPYEDKLAFGVWRYTARFPDVGEIDPALMNLARRRSSGGYAVGETRLAGRDDGARSTLSAFVQLGLASTEANRFGSYAGAGLVANGWIPGRASDQMGISIASVRNGSPYLEAQQAQGLRTSRAEDVVELTYLTPLTSWLSVQPDLQYIRHPDTDPSLLHAWVVQLRFEVAFQ